MQGEATAILTVLVCLSAVGVLVEADENINANASEVRAVKTGDFVFFQWQRHEKRIKVESGQSHD